MTLVEDTLARLARVPGVASELWLRCQPNGDLGARMHGALLASLSDAPAALVVGTDCPLIDASYVVAAVAALREHDVVLGPAEDGGYGLVGVNRPAPGLFEGIDWGGPAVMAQSRARARTLGLRHIELAPVWDVDRPADLPRLAALPDLPVRLRRLLTEVGV